MMRSSRYTGSLSVDLRLPLLIKRVRNTASRRGRGLSEVEGCGVAAPAMRERSVRQQMHCLSDVQGAQPLWKTIDAKLAIT